VEAHLVAPVYADLLSMEIYLPKGNEWIDYWNHQIYKGGQIIDYDTADAEKLPLFVRADSLIPMRAEADWIDPGAHENPLYPDVYPSSQPGSFTLYEDDGVTTEYQSGRFAKTAFEARREQNEDLTISEGESQGSYTGKPTSRSLEITVQLADKPPASVTKNAQPLAHLETAEALRASSEGWRYDPQGHVVVVKVNQPSASPSKIVIAAGP
jgi:alpha-glucosidase (family GH31 glycosyl hydrolase)